MRSKEQDPDYRFFSEPDIPTIATDMLEFEKIKQNLGKTPFARKKYFAEKYKMEIEEVQ